MPSGVSKDFLDHAKHHQRHALAALAGLSTAALLGGVVAELVSVERWGSFVLAYAGALTAGVLLGGLVGWRQIRSWAASLRDGWQAWMRAAVGAGSMPETAHRAGAKRFRLGHAWVGALVALNAACLIGAWFALPPFSLVDPYGVFALATVTVTGVSVGSAASKVIVEAWWCREVEGQTLELVEAGRVGVWGYR